MNRADAFPDLDVQSLERGYCFVRLPEPDAVRRTFLGMQDYFDQGAGVKWGHQRANGDEWGYRSVSAAKETYMVRNATLPSLLAPATDVWRQCHTLVKRSLVTIADQIGLPATALSDLVDSDAPPDLATEPSASVLRLLRYRPRHDGLGAEAHEDLGLLSYLPPSTLPALQALDYRDLDWHDIERPGTDFGILMVGRSLELLSHGRFIPCHHRVAGTPSARYAMVFQARMRADAQISARLFRLSGYPPQIRGDAFLAGVRRPLRSVNGTTYGQPC